MIFINIGIKNIFHHELGIFEEVSLYIPLGLDNLNILCYKPLNMYYKDESAI